MEMPSRCIGHATKETQHVTILLIFVWTLQTEENITMYFLLDKSVNYN
jgi:hypothetical protein